MAAVRESNLVIQGNQISFILAHFGRGLCNKACVILQPTMQCYYTDVHHVKPLDSNQNCNIIRFNIERYKLYNICIVQNNIFTRWNSVYIKQHDVKTEKEYFRGQFHSFQLSQYHKMQLFRMQSANFSTPGEYDSKQCSNWPYSDIQPYVCNQRTVHKGYFYICWKIFVVLSIKKNLKATWKMSTFFYCYITVGIKTRPDTHDPRFILEFLQYYALTKKKIAKCCFNLHFESSFREQLLVNSRISLLHNVYILLIFWKKHIDVFSSWKIYILKDTSKL